MDRFTKFFLSGIAMCIFILSLKNFFFTNLHLQYANDEKMQFQFEHHKQFDLGEFIKCKSMFIFGDSTLDSGTSNLTGSPFGIDFHEGSGIGRFSNGKTPADYLALSMKKSLPKPFNKLNEVDMMLSVPINFASGGCGILNSTRPLPYPFTCSSLRDQVDQFLNLTSLQVVANDVFYFSIGSNDFMFSLEQYKKKPQVFVKILISEYATQLQRLHKSGARKFLVSNIGPIGCIPDKRIAPDNECNDDLNDIVQDFNIDLVKALKKFVRDFGAEVVLVDCDLMFILFLDDPKSYGFNTTYKPCCGKWNKEQGRFQCNEDSVLCEDRNSHLFFDGAHPTDRANFHLINNCINGNICKPIIVTDYDL